MRDIHLGILKFHAIDSRRPLSIFWIIFTVTHILGLLVAFTFEKSNIIYGSSFVIYIFVSIWGFQLLKSSFPHLIQWGATRKGYFLYTSLYLILISLFMSLLNNILLLTFDAVIKTYSLTGINFYHLAQFGTITDNFATRIFIDFSISLLLISVALLLSSILFRFGLAVSGGLVVPIIVLTFIPGVVSSMSSFTQNYLSINGPLYFSYTVIGSLLIFLICWAVMRRSFIIPSV
ncbi:hypothetical protein [Sporosarcina sp. G11-34]|uniref:hypothetical protein n=1 Tax=Sporosarcina sp. G11-34 TaxID=2849605 RepID=UPI0022A98C07|nr:hypothetical protein [Sporosarcina sp. G11-34]MCZ2259632.1 hypothetical protein [Sporosarcina sp. G11-34]